MLKENQEIKKENQEIKNTLIKENQELRQQIVIQNMMQNIIINTPRKGGLYNIH